MSLSFSSSMRSPERTTGWSSASTIVICSSTAFGSLTTATLPLAGFPACCEYPVERQLVHPANAALHPRSFP